jgi:CRISPR-associated protein Cmr2
MSSQPWLQRQRALYNEVPNVPATLATHPVTGEWQISPYLQNQFWWGGGASQEAYAQLAAETNLPHLAVVTFGPIQTFLGAGQRLRDWAVASWLCHYLSAVLIDHWEANGGQVLLPLHQRCNLVQWLKGETSGDETFWQAELPNVVTGLYPDEPGWLARAEATIQAEWSRFIQAMEPAAIEFAPKVLNGVGWRVIHRDHEYLWSVYGESTSADPAQFQAQIGQLYQQIESRKVSRDWQGTWWGGRTSPTAGSLSVWHPGLQPIHSGGTWGLPSTDLEAWWAKAVKSSLGGLFSGGDRLNSLELVKRLASVPDIIVPLLQRLWNRQPPPCPWGRFPDRAAIAAAWVPAAVAPDHWNQGLADAYEYFDRQPKPWGVPQVDKLNQDNPQTAYLHPDLLERRGVADWADEEQLNDWQQLIPAHWDSPIEWTVGWRGDGDNMGKWLSGQQYQKLNLPWSRWHLTPDLIQQQQLGIDPPTVPESPRQIDLPHMLDLSVLLSYWNRLLYPLVEQEHRGKVIFAGGDDFLLLGPLTEAVALTTDLHQLWSGQASSLTTPVTPPAEGWVTYQDQPYPVPGQTMQFSLGVVIAQRRVPQSLWHRGLNQAYKQAKAQGRNRVCVQVLFNSGQSLTWVCPWPLWHLLMAVEPQGDGQTELNRWEKLLAYMESSRLQQASITTVSAMVDTLWAGVGLDLTWAQVEALGRRHYRQEISDWQWWLAWLSLRAFLARQAGQRQQWIQRVQGGRQ